MSIFRALEISSQGMSVQRERVSLASSNLANAETTRGPDGGPYRRLDPVFEAVLNDDGTAGVKVAEVVADAGEGKATYMPGHPDADAAGFVRLPDVNPVHEVVNLVSAQRGFEANASAVDTAKAMAQRALEIMR